jgi:hypothetical protein
MTPRITKALTGGFRIFTILMNSQSFEAVYVVFICCIVGMKLLDQPFLNGLWLLLVAVAVSTQTFSFPLKLKEESVFDRYMTRKNKSQGVLIGIMALPCLLASIAASSESEQKEYWMLMFHASCCCSLCLLSFLISIKTSRPQASGISFITFIIAALSPLSSLCVSGSIDTPLPWPSLILPLLALPCYHLLLEHLTGTLTLGEAAIVCQGGLVLSALAIETLAKAPALPFFIDDSFPLRSFLILVPFWILGLAVSTWGIVSSKHHLTTALSCTILTLSVLALSDLAAWVLFTFLPLHHLVRRPLIIAYWTLLTASTLPLMNHASKWNKGNSRLALLRKGYHLLLLAIFLPIFLIDQDMLCVSASIAFAAMIFLETLRCSGLLPSNIRSSLQAFMESFTDDRDSGPICTTHISLLLGASIPLWISLTTQPGLPDRSLALSGLVCLGVGDTAASVFGILWPGKKVRLFADSNKTLQGAVAGLMSMLLFWSCTGILSPFHPSSLPIILATCGSALLEASTHQIDNLVLPLAFSAHLLLSHPTSTPPQAS